MDLQDLDYLDTEFPSPLWISQADLEREMLAKLSEYHHGKEVVQRGVVAEVIAQTADYVTVMFTRKSNSAALESNRSAKNRYIVGFDGERSASRHYLRQLSL